MKARIKTIKQMRIMAKIKELLAGREKLKKYDELTEWKDIFGKEGVYLGSSYEVFKSGIVADIPDDIKQIVVNALDAEIAKLDEE